MATTTVRPGANALASNVEGSPATGVNMWQDVYMQTINSDLTALA
jgi:hypothetical protein